ncbi:hypothetical protein PRIPAC_75446 [Pristionchus pacificus]|uniref:Uncharacterized protein n=1 Tax=Pristionchus pacificus TaxID=54126 RepID=A0A2A6C0N4_PRIPA|nr:hypothetical protein PRIPAC_75446 [Pristionchus pacificus]|eukprot:PDM71591.1 hypothetical protein PRIPAC_37998 [Pristionchus pacificus]
MTRFLLLALPLFLVTGAAPLETIAEEKSSELRDLSKEVNEGRKEVEELTYPEKLPEFTLFEGDSSVEELSADDRKTLEELILNPIVTEEHVMNVTYPDPEPTLGQKLKALFAKFQDKVKNLGTNAKEVVELVRENIQSMRTQQKDPNASEDEVKQTAWKKMVYTIKRWLALNDEGKAQLRNYFPTLAKFLDNEKLQKQLCGFSCVVADTNKENKEAREAKKGTTEEPATQADAPIVE